MIARPDPISLLYSPCLSNGKSEIVVVILRHFSDNGGQGDGCGKADRLVRWMRMYRMKQRSNVSSNISVGGI